MCQVWRKNWNNLENFFFLPILHHINGMRSFGIWSKIIPKLVSPVMITSIQGRCFHKWCNTSYLNMKLHLPRFVLSHHFLSLLILETCWWLSGQPGAITWFEAGKPVDNRKESLELHQLPHDIAQQTVLPVLQANWQVNQSLFEYTWLKAIWLDKHASGKLCHLSSILIFTWASLFY